MVVQRGESFFVYLPAGPEKGCEEIGKAQEIVVRGRTAMGLMARKRIAVAIGADKAIMTFCGEKR